MFFVDEYKKGSSDVKLMDEAKDRLVRQLLSEKKVGENKIDDLDDSDMESKVKVQFMPSMIYTFKYTSSSDSINGLKFCDVIPIVLVCEKTPKSVSGINFNLLPREVRAVFFETIDKAYNNFYTGKGLEKAKDGELAVNEEFAALLLNEKSRIAFFNLLESKMGVSIKKAYRKYNMSHIENPRMIEYGEYKYITMLAFDDSVRGINLAKLQESVIRPDK